MQHSRTGDVSFWYADMGGLPQQRPPLDGDTAVDVCIVGAGYTGLWAAYYLRQADPSLRILIVEQRFAGFGASGRNGGWLTGGFAWNHHRYLSTGTPESIPAAVDADPSLDSTVDTSRVAGWDEPATVTIANRSGRVLELADDGEHKWFGFQIESTNGRLVPPIHSNYQLSPMTLGVGESVKRSINLTPLYPIADFGVYRVRAVIYDSVAGQYFSSAPPLNRMSVGMLRML
jgi:hypothetical protein